MTTLVEFIEKLPTCSIKVNIVEIWHSQRFYMDKEDLFPLIFCIDIIHNRIYIYTNIHPYFGKNVNKCCCVESVDTLTLILYQKRK